MRFQSYNVAQIGKRKCLVNKIADYISYTFAHTFLISICPSHISTKAKVAVRKNKNK